MSIFLFLYDSYSYFCTIVILTDDKEQLINAFFNDFGSDPQEAFLASSFDINATSVLDELVTEALLPQNVVSQTDLPTFLGGSTLTGTSAFSGNAFDEQGEVIAGVQVGFGVFAMGSGANFFSPISFAATQADLERIATLEWDLSPVVPASFTGTFETRGRSLLAVEAAPSPATLPLVLIRGFSLLVFCRLQKTDDQRMPSRPNTGGR